jgi:hypothetical protein
MIAKQVHDKFKVFTGELTPDQTIGKLADTVAKFASGVAAKSIGVEYLEGAKKLLITLGYRDDAEPYPVRLQSMKLGKVDVMAKDFSALEAAMGEASSKLDNIICHELYITDKGDFIAVFMTHEA